MIKFEDIFKIDNKNEVKIKLNMNAGNSDEPALDFLLAESVRWIEMVAWKEKSPQNNYSDAKYVLAFAQYYPYGKEYYMFGGLYKIEKKLPEVFGKEGYSIYLQSEFEQYRKRLIIRLKKPVGQNYNIYYDTLIKYEPEIYEILPSARLGKFPGYSSVCLTHRQLQLIYKNDEPEWKNALSSVKGVYCITDTSNGQLYIGSAYGDYAGIWQRWEQYANVNNLTGGNKSFEDLKKSDSDRIINNFTYSILEIFDPKTSDEDIIHREEHWKKVFKTVEFGMNNARYK